MPFPDKNFIWKQTEKLDQNWKKKTGADVLNGHYHYKKCFFHNNLKTTCNVGKIISFEEEDQVRKEQPRKPSPSRPSPGVPCQGVPSLGSPSPGRPSNNKDMSSNSENIIRYDWSVRCL